MTLDSNVEQKSTRYKTIKDTRDSRAWPVRMQPKSAVGLLRSVTSALVEFQARDRVVGAAAFEIDSFASF